MLSLLVASLEEAIERCKVDHQNRCLTWPSPRHSAAFLLRQIQNAQKCLPTRPFEILAEKFVRWIFGVMADRTNHFLQPDYLTLNFYDLPNLGPDFAHVPLSATPVAVFGHIS